MLFESLPTPVSPSRESAVVMRWEAGLKTTVTTPGGCPLTVLIQLSVDTSSLCLPTTSESDDCSPRRHGYRPPSQSRDGSWLLQPCFFPPLLCCTAHSDTRGNERCHVLPPKWTRNPPDWCFGTGGIHRRPLLFWDDISLCWHQSSACHRQKKIKLWHLETYYESLVWSPSYTEPRQGTPGRHHTPWNFCCISWSAGWSSCCRVAIIVKGGRVRKQFE